MPGAPENRISLILDTNVFVAAYWAPSSASARLIEACKIGLAQAHYSPEVRREVEHVLRTIKVRDSYLRSLDSFWENAIEVPGAPVESVRTEDPDDQKFLEAAFGGDTDFLVTNDVHLLKVGYVGRTEIVTPRSAVRLIGLSSAPKA